MAGTDALPSVQDATQSQGVSLEHTQPPSVVTSAVPRQNQRKAICSPPEKPKPLKSQRPLSMDSKIKKQLSFSNCNNDESNDDDNNKENVSPNTSVQSSLRRSPRIAQEPLSPLAELCWQENPSHSKETTSTPPIKFPYRFEKTPDAISLAIKPNKNNKEDIMISQQELHDKCKALKNFHPENIKIVAEKVNGVRVCEDINGEQFPKVFSLKTSCCKFLFFSKPVLETERRGRTGRVNYDPKKIQETMRLAEGFKQANNEIELPTIVTLEKIKQNPALLRVLIFAPDQSIPRVPITLVVLKKWEFKGQKPRYPSQLSAFGISGKDLAGALAVDDPENEDGKSNFELTHRYGYSLGGPDGIEPQVATNLFVATRGANTWMMLAEDLVRYLLKDHQDKVKTVFVSVDVTYLLGTKVAERIDYVIYFQRIDSNKEKSMIFKFDGLDFEPPPKALEYYFRQIVDMELEHLHSDEVITNITKVIDEDIRPFVDFNLITNTVVSSDPGDSIEPVSNMSSISKTF